MKKIAYVCVHNSCRSQIAEAFTKKYGEGIVEAYSAGTETKDRINQDAVRLMKEIYGIDMEESQRPKRLEEIPPVDYLITMGCDVKCPLVPYQQTREDWGLDDPTGQSDQVFKKIIRLIEEKVLALIEEVNEKR